MRILALLPLLFPLALEAGDNVRFVRLTSIKAVNGFNYQHFDLSTNETVELVSKHATQTLGGSGYSVAFSPTGDLGIFDDMQFGHPILGPGAVILLPGDAEVTFATFKVTTVNQEASPALPVVPAGASAVVSLEKSSDLKAWTATTNGAVTAGDTNVFFRVRIDR